MAWVAVTTADAVERLSRQDCTLERITLLSKQLADVHVSELADCLLRHPDVITDLTLAGNELTDVTGVKLARYVAASSTVESLYLFSNRLGEATHLAMAAALRVNTSLELLNLHDNLPVDHRRVDAAFVDALRLNPGRPAGTYWQLHSYANDIERLQPIAKQLGHPSLQLLLAASLSRAYH